MMYTVYAIRSLVTDRIYIGQTGDFECQFKEHNAGGVRSTKKHRPWELYAGQRFMLSGRLKDPKDFARGGWRPIKLGLRVW
jgi:predicted GIY-YIG superfamily endonuclease